MQIHKAYEISNAKIQFVSLVDKAANQRQFLVSKAQNGQAQFSTLGKIIKVDSEAHYLTGIVYEPLVADAHGNFMTEDEIRKAAYWFKKNGDKVDIQHSFEPAGGVEVVETYITPCDMQVGESLVAKGTWLMTVEVTDPDIWASVQKGEITGFSMGGMGVYGEEDVALDTVEKTESAPDLEKKGFFKKMAEFFGYEVLEKGAMADTYTERARYSNFWDAFYVLEDILYGYDYATGRYELISDEATIREALSEFTTIVTEILAGRNIAKSLSAAAPLNTSRDQSVDILETVTKALREFRKGAAAQTNEMEEISMTKQEMQEMIDAAVQKAVNTAVQADAADGRDVGNPAPVVQSDAQAEAAPAAESPAAEDIQKMIEVSVEKAMVPLLKARGVPSNLNDAGQVEKSEPHYLAGIL